MAGAPVESCRSPPKRSPWGRLGSVLYTCKRLHRRRRRFKHFWSISLSRPHSFSNKRPAGLALASLELDSRSTFPGLGSCGCVGHKEGGQGLLPGLSESTRLLHRWRKRCRRLPTTRPTPRDHQEPTCPRKSVQFGPDGAPFPSKTSITRGPPVVAVAVPSDPILPHR